MDFNIEYQNIKNLVQNELDSIETTISNLFLNNTPIEKELLNLIKRPSKRLRPLIGILFFKTVFNTVSEEQKQILAAVELIHNATLIHDDIIDNSNTRRGEETINSKFNNSLAVISGDYLLSLAMETITNLNSSQIIKTFSKAIKSTCMGEINQYFNKHKITSIEDYIQKSKDKTAVLFQVGIISGLEIKNIAPEDKIFKLANDFIENFGIAFQIRDDLINVLNNNDKAGSDIDEGIFNAPIIYAHEENNTIIEQKNVYNLIKTTKGIEKTKILMDNYFDNAICSLNNIEENKYKLALIKLIKIFKNHL